MGICLSSEPLEKQESDENIVCVVEEDEFGYGEGEVRMLASLYSRQGKKGPNQDAAILCTGYGMEEGVFCGVFDGHGRNGHIVSRLVRDYLPSLLLRQRNALLLAEEESDDSSDGTDASSVDADDSSLSSPETFDEWKAVFIQAFRVMDKELKLQPNLDFSFSGTTAVSIIKQGKDLIIANLGDSRAIMGTISEEGRHEAMQLTTDLKPCVPKAARIRKNNGRIFALKDEPHTQRVWLPNDNYPGLAMARAFGDFQLKDYGVISIPQVSYRRLSERDQFIVLATDGVWDVLSNERVVSIVWSAESKEDASKALVEAAVRAWRSKFPTSKVDDCSAACLFLQDRWQGLMIPRVKKASNFCAFGA
ncbi:probable protein phosphatase 2C 12 isoform X2 [Phoenix dactylifera]|uniref:protein-serine/threonine phosphatase n=1 Tax=Phoenix dactylifera TaxID=42345 RepID=A0A8B8J209_PHODC|nr:probable protein phosphatase 2C 12 isoform X2 [Phoenix dactylifera]